MVHPEMLGAFRRKKKVTEVSEPTNGELARVLEIIYRTPTLTLEAHEAEALHLATRRLREMDGERVEGYAEIHRFKGVDREELSAEFHTYERVSHDAQHHAFLTILKPKGEQDDGNA